jgi:hypothetical protein
VGGVVGMGLHFREMGWWCDLLPYSNFEMNIRPFYREIFRDQESVESFFNFVSPYSEVSPSRRDIYRF